MKPRYTLENEKYVFYLDERRIFATEEVAVLSSAQPSLLLMHGQPNKVAEYAGQLAAFSTLFNHFYADQPSATPLRNEQGRFELSSLNRMVEASYLGMPFDPTALIKLN
ncbi:MAG: hypothetical protein Q7S87_05175 [Agitococcus sp.]|nr:hypothetical protein [Agitococcus sp.]